MTDIFPISLCVGILLIFLEKLRNNLGFTNLRKSVQTLHKKSISRFGGIAIFISLLVIAVLSNITQYDFLIVSIMCICPIFVLGVLDDMEINISPLIRLMIVFPSAFLSYYFLGIEAYSLQIPFIDDLFNYDFFSIIFICFAIAGIVNAFNLIDGVNGMVLLFALSICSTTILSGFTSSSESLTLFFVALFFSVLGIFVLNFPFGRIFIGDGGAYFLGAILAIGLIKVYQINSLSPWYVFLMFIYPVTDVFASLIRRISTKRSTLEPDNKHLHHMILRRVRKMGFESSLTHHSIVTLLTFCLYLPFMLGANYFAKDTLVLVILCFIFICFYFCLYILLVPKNFRKQ